MPRNPSNPLASIICRTMPEPTLRAVFEDYKRYRRVKPQTLQKYEYMIEKCFPDWWDRNLNDISKSEILERHLQISNRNGPRGTGMTEANRVFVVLRAVYRFAEGRYEDEKLEPVIRRNPVTVLTAARAWHKSKRRSRTIPRHKMQAWFAAVQRYRNDSIRDYLSFIFLTGCRRTEAVSLQWDWVDLQGGFVAFPAEAVKNGEEFVLPLSPYLWHMLKQRKARQDADKKWVFPGGVPGKHLSNRLKCTDKIFRETGINWSVHDLRRTFATIADTCVHSDLMVKRLLNHKIASNNVTAGYICHDPESLRPHVDAIAARILEYSGFQFVPPFGLVPIEMAEQVQAEIQEAALVSALRKLDPEILQAIASGKDTASLVHLSKRA